MEVRNFVCLCVCIWVTTAGAEPGDQHQCSNPRVMSKSVLVNSLVGDDGNLVAMVNFEKEKSRDQGAGSWQVEVVERTENCEKGVKSANIIYKLTTTPPRPGPGYELFPGIGYYKLHPVALAWPKAREVCEQEGTHLAIINSEKEADVAKQLMARYPKLNGVVHQDWLWIGLERTQPGGEWVTVFGDPMKSTGFMRWHTNRPSAGNTENCVLIHRTLTSLHDNPCTVADAFICERELW